MSLINDGGRCLGIQYLLDDTEFIVDPSELYTNEASDDKICNNFTAECRYSHCYRLIIYTNGSQSFVINGHFLQDTSDDTSTLVLQEGDDINQYLINDDRGELLLANVQNEEQGTQQIVQCVDEEGNRVSPEILYINEDGIISTQENSTHYDVSELLNISKNSLLDGDQGAVIDLDDLIQQQNVDGSVFQLNPVDWFQYTVVKDNGLHYAIPTIDLSQTNIQDETDSLLDISAITGKNLLTGQVVTLDGYMDKVQRKLKSISKNSATWNRPKHNLNAFLNKKFNLGLTVGGRSLVGKIVHVGSKAVNNETNFQLKEQEDGDISAIPAQMSSEINLLKNSSKNDQVHVKTKLHSKKSDRFQQISKTLSDLMNMEALCTQLRGKSIQIKVVDKYYDKTKKSTKNVFFISGYMELKKAENDETGENWAFVPDVLSNSASKSQVKYPKTISLTIMTTYQNNESYVKVVIDQNDCDEIQNSDEHLESIKENNADKLKVCPYCKGKFTTDPALKKHMAMHKLEAFKCSVCPFSGMNEADLKLHSQNHPNSCDICSEIFVTESNLNVHKKKHRKNTIKSFKNTVTKYYSCQICKRTFSRQSNLQRHSDVHKGTGQLYRCAICKCSYHYISSLTRHIVQNHVQINRSNLAPIVNETRLDTLL